jgi:hypothetical protein
MVQKIADGPRVVVAQKKTGRILQVGSQRVSSIVYGKAKDLLKAGAIGQLNMVDAWWDRNSAVGAWQYAIPPDASPQTIALTGTGSWAARPSARSSRSACFGGETIRTTEQGSRAIYSFTSSPVCTTSSELTVRRVFSLPVDFATGRMDEMSPMYCSVSMTIPRRRHIPRSTWLCV